MIGAAFEVVAAVLKRVPWWAWALLVLAVAAIGFGQVRYAQGFAAGGKAEAAAHAKVLKDLADKTAKVAEKVRIAHAAYTRETRADLARHDQEKRDAYEAGRAAAAAIAAGDVRVRTVWRDRECPQADARSSAGPAAGHPAIDPGRADAIGRVLGHAWQWDAAYGLAYARLQSAQALIDACYDQPAHAGTNP